MIAAGVYLVPSIWNSCVCAVMRSFQSWLANCCVCQMCAIIVLYCQILGGLLAVASDDVVMWLVC
jgi:hypothetical protein